MLVLLLLIGASGSLVLAMDAVHHFVDVAAIVVALVALELSTRPTSSILSRTFTDKDGYQHFFAELVASLGEPICCCHLNEEGSLVKWTQLGNSEGFNLSFVGRHLQNLGETRVRRSLCVEKNIETAEGL